MKVELKIEFTQDEVFEMCREKLRQVDTVVPGKFDLSREPYGTGVIATFEPDGSSIPE